jgi:prophage antirepressor-like protein
MGRPQRTTIISEAGLYSLIMTSRKPEAREFKRWITHTVLPSIRKNGGYVAGQGKLKTGEESPAEFLAQQPRRPSVPLQHPSI